MTVLKIPVTKAKGKFVEVDTDAIENDQYYMEALKQGFKVIVNGGATKITAAAYPDEGERHEAAYALAAKRVEEMVAGTLKLGRTSSASTKSGVSGAVMTEARRIAKDIIKQTIKANGLKVSHYKASEITAAANTLIDDDASILAQAEKNLAERGKIHINSDLLGGLKADPTLVAKTEAAKNAKKAEREAAKANRPPLSAKQAGQTAHRPTH
jgi:hypothetical protein